MPGTVEGEAMKRLFDHILLATDGSEKNLPAVREALEIARACGSLLHAVYVIDETPYTSAPTDVLTVDVYSQSRDEGERALEEVKRLADGVRVETLILSGRAAQVITDFAARNRVDLIVVGSQGKSGLERLLLGSTAESIIRTARCMVLVVKSP
jgi:nucleotide-binding universal stress UspA family protein